MFLKKRRNYSLLFEQLLRKKNNLRRMNSRRKKMRGSVCRLTEANTELLLFTGILIE